ncbi:MAG: hypothetical protein ABS79_04285 [Planctomycetes bacterium SCN 63-9]|nr:MAG: hypothetical protein ABS79_04285 [Planctomycetes bacterium SCN 63-9]
MAVLAIAVVAVASIFFSIPWMVNWPFIKDRLAREVNVIFAPSKVSFDSISVSWFGPSSVRGLELIDGENRRVVTAPRATLDWNLFQILFTRPKVANVVLEDGRADIVRETNGKINLIESIRPILVPRPERTVVIRLQHGNVKVRPSPEARSLVDDPADVLLDFAAYPGPITWDLKFSRVKSGESPSNLDLGGKLERVAAEGSELPDFELHLASKRWAVSHGQTGSAVSGTIDANLEARRRQGHWSSNGQATVENFAADANAIDGHNPDFRLSKTQASWKVLDSPEGWDTTVRVEAPFATLDAQGIMTGTLEEKLVLALNAELSNVDLPDALESEPSRPSREPLKTSMTLAYDAKADRLDLSGLDLAIPLVRVRGEGSVAGLTSKRTVDLRGTLEPDWDALQKQLAEKVEPRARLAGRSKPTQPSIPISANFPSGIAIPSW